MEEGDSFAIGFRINDYIWGGLGHSTVLGPRTMVPENFPQLRVNVHYDQSDTPELSISSPGTNGVRTDVVVDHDYEALVTRSGDTAVLELYDATAGAVVHTDEVPWDWPAFDGFQLAYDYYGGGYCTWDEPNAEVDFLVDRGSTVMEGSVDYVCLRTEFVQYFMIAGLIHDVCGDPEPDVLLTATGGATALTDSAGYYEFATLLGGQAYTIAPSKDGCSFIPETYSFENLNEDMLHADFVAHCYDYLCMCFVEDPHIFTYSGADASESHYVCFDGQVNVEEGECFRFGFRINDYIWGGLGHSTVLGPRMCDPENFPQLRVNVHYDQSDKPELSISSPGTNGARTDVEVGHEYEVRVTRSGDTAVLELYDATTGMVVHTDEVPWGWPAFDGFQLAYDYYGGGYCEWDEAGEEVAFLVDRGATSMEGDITHLCIPAPEDVHAIAGYVHDRWGAPIQDVELTATGGYSTVTGADGAYQLGGLPTGDYTVTPSREGFTFEPGARTYENLEEDVSAQNYLAYNSDPFCYEFEEDPGILTHVNADGSETHYFQLPDTLIWHVEPGEALAVGFRIDSYQWGGLGHSSVVGPRSVVPEEFAQLRLNLHYDQEDAPEFSISSPGEYGDRVDLLLGHEYNALVTNLDGYTAALELYDATTGVVVHSESLAWDWTAFGAFQLAYDYYGGGYCEWDEAGEEVDFLVNRGSTNMNGAINYVCVIEQMSDAPELPLVPTEVSMLALPQPRANSEVQLVYALPNECWVTLDICDVTGRRICRLVQQNLPAGRHTAVWDGTSSSGHRVGRSVFFAVLRANDEQIVKKLIRW